MSVRVAEKSYEMPPSDGFTLTLFITVADINRGVRSLNPQKSDRRERPLRGIHFRTVNAGSWPTSAGSDGR